MSKPFRKLKHLKPRLADVGYLQHLQQSPCPAWFLRRWLWLCWCRSRGRDSSRGRSHKDHLSPGHGGLPMDGRAEDCFSFSSFFNLKKNSYAPPSGILWETRILGHGHRSPEFWGSKPSKCKLINCQRPAVRETHRKSPPPVHQLRGFDQAAPVAPAFEKSLVKGDAQEPGHADGDDTHLV